MSRAGTTIATLDSIRYDIAAAGIFGHWTTADTLEPSLRDRGAYLLALVIDTAVDIDLPRQGRRELAPATYLYAGSAKGPGGLRARVGRHFRHEKPRRWHVDRLTCACRSMAALLVANGGECDLVDRLLVSGRFVPALPGFGNSDCQRCVSHLLRPSDPNAQ